ncbi:MAG: hypothetical protein PUF29_17500 [Anaerobutyricum hallii]|uniref:hypothetical protein n=1 Tax=Anaerobutyricum hallii TaxID=39488 RepID=UPI0024303C32|nr:hypothetical protein [Anaerobutyricum hallii]MDD6590350.1 hypothetical protein [Anaerobutyricum hallii]
MIKTKTAPDKYEVLLFIYPRHSQKQKNSEIYKECRLKFTSKQGYRLIESKKLLDEITTRISDGYAQINPIVPRNKGNEGEMYWLIFERRE